MGRLADGGLLEIEEVPVKGHRRLVQEATEHLERLVEDRTPLPLRHREGGAFGRARRGQPEDGQHPLGREPGERRQLFGDEDRRAAGQHRDPGTDFQCGGTRQRIRHADERIDQRRVNELGKPQ